MGQVALENLWLPGIKMSRCYKASNGWCSHRLLFKLGGGIKIDARGPPGAIDYRRNQNLIWRSTGILWKWKRNVFAVKYTEHKFYHIFNHFSVHNSVASSAFMLFYHHHQRRNFIAICRWCAISAHDLYFICCVIWTFPSNLSHIAKYQYYNDLEIKQKKRN